MMLLARVFCSVRLLGKKVRLLGADQIELSDQVEVKCQMHCRRLAGPHV